MEYYELASKIACDACQVEGEAAETDPAAKHRMLKEVIMNPSKLSRLDMKGYYE
jgi:transcriptional accessory protein Tex/SPT6